MSNKPDGTRENPHLLSDDKFANPMIRFMVSEEREDGTLFLSPDSHEYYFSRRDMTFTRAQEKRIIELIESVFRRALPNA